MDVNKTICDLGMMGDLNVMEHLNQTTTPPLLVNKATEDEDHNENFGETVDGEKGGVTEETQTKIIMMRERKIMREKKLTRKMKKVLILSATITGQNMIHCRCMERSIILVIITILLYLYAAIINF
jgi:hypothetical protein